MRSPLQRDEKPRTQHRQQLDAAGERLLDRRQRGGHQQQARFRKQARTEGVDTRQSISHSESVRDSHRRNARLEADREGEMRDSQQQQMSKYHEEEADEVTKEGQLLQVMADVADDCWTEMACKNGQGTGHHENDEH
ncbi:MAG: hypothetical protein SGPRY_003085 [Prymnesium sp.]